MTYTKTSPYFAFFRPFRRFLRWNGRTTRHQREKPPQRRTGGQNRPRCAVAPVRFAPGGLPGCPSAWPCAPLGAGQGSLWRALRFAASGGRAPVLRPVLVASVCVGHAACAAQWGALR